MEKRFLDPTFLVFGLAALAVLTSLWVLLWARPGSGLGPDVPISEVFCMRWRANAAEQCISTCARHSDNDACNTSCMVTLHDALGACNALKMPSANQFQLLYSAGDPPPWPELRGLLGASFAAMAKCEASRGGFTARVQVRADRPDAVVSVGAPERSMADCFAARLSRLHASQPYRSDYLIALRGTPPPSVPSPPKPRDIEAPVLESSE